MQCEFYHDLMKHAFPEYDKHVELEKARMLNI